MTTTKLISEIVRGGDVEGLGTVYSEWGGLISKSGELVLHSAEGWEVNIRSPWRSVLPKMIFTGFVAPTRSRLYITSQRIVLIRQIDVLRELKGELTPLGLPKAAEREVELRKLVAAGARQFCEIWPRSLYVAKLKRHGRPAHALDLFLLGSDGKQYFISFWRPTGSEPQVVSLIESQFETSR